MLEIFYIGTKVEGKIGEGGKSLGTSFKIELAPVDGGGLC